MWNSISKHNFAISKSIYLKLMKIIQNSLIATALILVIACNHQNKSWKDPDISGVPISDVMIKRYEKALFTIDKKQLKTELLKIAGDYQVFLKGDLDDTLNLLQLSNYITDPLLISIYDTTIERYPDMKDTEKQLTTAFRYYIYYFPEKPVPHVYTFISGLDYEIPAIFLDTALLIAIDMYLGQDYKPYGELGLPAYMISRFSEKYLVSDCMNEIAASLMQNTPCGNSMLDQMVYEGKRLMLLDAFLPQVADDIKIKYTPEQLEWCRKNEANLWKFIIENELLYSTDIQVINKFFVDGPFTHGFESSPPRLGAWLGWQIIRSYMEKQKDVNMKTLLDEADAQKILTTSRYKPRR
ncbi:MAG: hypothetical protein NT175_14300 [Bacteroidetes bacterium]|nr:hypothetical protein [Bacteroidota bacterium]